MLEFKKLTIENFCEVEKYFEYELERQSRHRVRMSDRTPGSVLLWFREYDVEFAHAGDSVIFYSKTGEHEKSYYYPIGKHKRAALKLLKEYIKNNGGCASIAAVGETSLAKITREMFVGEAFASRDTADYIYNKAEFENPAGRKHHKRKNLINRYLSEFPDAHIVLLNADNLVSARDYYNDYCKRNPESSSVEDMEYRAVNALFDNFNFKYFSGGMLVANNKIMGITIAQIYGDTVYVHIEKAEKEIAGSYQTLNKEYLLTITDENVKYVNREEDMGLPGLRRSKMAYCPAWLEYKYMLKISAE
ncbi:MAG: DUF2156 domain-containing protein [Clostridia bacterium]|nr:DUF2156 domain-containing protein [Clostridia bacterium]